MRATRMLAVIGAIALTLSLTVGAGVPAQAVGGVIGGYQGPKRPAAPSPSAVWGIATSYSAGALGHAASWPAGGGWDVHSGTSFGVSSPPVTGQVNVPQSYRISEPFNFSQTGGNYVEVSLEIGMVKPQPEGKYAGPSYSLGTSASVDPAKNKVYCSNTQWTEPSNVFVAGSVGGYSNSGASVVTGYRTIGGTLVVYSSACPYLVRFEVGLQSYANGLNNDPSDPAPKQTRFFNWYAEQYYTGQKYSPSDDQTLGSLCAAYSVTLTSASCDTIKSGTIKDMTQIQNACPSPPAPAWLDFSWLPSFVGYYADCLFNPKGNIAGAQRLTDTWNATGAGQIVTQVTDSAASYRGWGAGCGDLVDVQTGMLHGFRISTCSWSWAGDLKGPLSVFVIVLSGWWLLNFYARSFLGVIERKSPSPIADESAD